MSGADHDAPEATTAEPAPAPVTEPLATGPLPEPPSANDTPAPEPRAKSPWSAHARTAGLSLALFAAAAFFLKFVNGFYPIQRWLFLRYAGYWGLCLLWATACISTGHVIVRRLCETPLRLLEHVCTSFATGVLAFATLVFVAGTIGILGTPVFVLLPLGMIAVGARPLVRLARRAKRHARALVKNRKPPSAIDYLAWGFGLLSLGMIYFVILTPENAQFDARWKHLALAEQYAHLGRMPRFPEGWTVATNPHMGSLLYTWAFLLPGGRLFDHVELAAHMELTVFLFSLAFIPAAVKVLVPRASVASTWAVRFLFPGIFLYDSSLSCNADHIAGLYALPVFLAMLRVLRTLSPRWMMLLAVMLAGATMPKLTGGLMLLPVPAVAIGARVLWALLREPARRKRALAACAAGVGVGLALTAPFWLENWIWYGDPLYPSLHAKLHLRPWTRDASDLFEWGYKEYQFWRPKHTLHGLWQTLKAQFDFSFVPNDYPKFHGKVPVFGSLFTLSLLFLPFLKRTKRIWALVGCVQVSIFVWYWIHHQDRYLQTMVPAMAAVVAAVLVLVWRSGVLPRVGASTLVVAQAVWGGDVWFIPTHAMIGSPQKKVLDLLASGYEKKYDQRFSVFEPWVSAGKALPEKARVLLHDNHVHLGLARSTVSDWGGWQFGISYGRLGSRRAVDEMLRDFGVTHVLWENGVSKGWDSLAGDLVFFDYALDVTKDQKRVHNLVIGAVPPAPPAERASNAVVVMTCGDLYANGLYDLGDLTVPVFGPENRRFPKPRQAIVAGHEDELLREAGFAVVDSKCVPHMPSEIGRDFALAARRAIVNVGRRKGSSTWSLYVRRAGSTIEASPSAAPADDDEDEPPGSP